MIAWLIPIRWIISLIAFLLALEWNSPWLLVPYSILMSVSYGYSLVGTDLCTTPQPGRDNSNAEKWIRRAMHIGVLGQLVSWATAALISFATQGAIGAIYPAALFGVIFNLGALRLGASLSRRIRPGDAPIYFEFLFNSLITILLLVSVGAGLVLTPWTGLGALLVVLGMAAYGLMMLFIMLSMIHLHSVVRRVCHEPTFHRSTDCSETPGR